MFNMVTNVLLVFYDLLVYSIMFDPSSSPTCRSHVKFVDVLNNIFLQFNKVILKEVLSNSNISFSSFNLFSLDKIELKNAHPFSDTPPPP